MWKLDVPISLIPCSASHRTPLHSGISHFKWLLSKRYPRSWVRTCDQVISPTADLLWERGMGPLNASSKPTGAWWQVSPTGRVFLRNQYLYTTSYRLVLPPQMLRYVFSFFLFFGLSREDCYSTLIRLLNAVLDTSLRVQDCRAYKALRSPCKSRLQLQAILVATAIARKSRRHRFQKVAFDRWISGSLSRARVIHPCCNAWLFLYTSTICPPHAFFAPLKSLACRFLVMLGNFTLNPSRSFDIFTWHPSLEVSVKPNARSNMSFSSSSGSSILSYILFCSTMTWHVEQAHEPPHAPDGS